MTPAEFATLRPDTAQWLDLRGFLLSGRAVVHANDDPRSGFVVRSLDQTVAIAAGRPTASVVRAAVDRARTDPELPDSGDWHLLAPPESVDAVAAALPGWRRRGVTLHERVRLPAPAPCPADVVLLEAVDGWERAGLEIGGLPRVLRDELATPSTRRAPLVAALVEGAPVSFCYAAVASPTLWDVAVETLPHQRRRGLAALCFERLAQRLADRGCRPVWGALDENTASLRLAARLGFEPSARLTSFVPG